MKRPFQNSIILLSFSLSPQKPSFHLSYIGRILLLQQYQSEDCNGHRAVVSDELTHLSSVCIQKVDFHNQAYRIEISVRVELTPSELQSDALTNLATKSQQDVRESNSHRSRERAVTSPFVQRPIRGRLAHLSYLSFQIARPPSSHSLLFHL